MTTEPNQPKHKPLKPWRSYGDQLALLRERGLQVDDDVAARDYLARLGYYRLSGYWYPLRAIDTEASTVAGKPVRRDAFQLGSHFQKVVALYVFDKKLRLLALDALERIEMAVRVDVAHVLGQRDPLGHLKPEHLHGNFTKKRLAKGQHAGKTEHELWLEKFSRQLHQARRQDFVKHHQQTYGDIPVWAAVEVWDFGLLSKLYAGMQYEDRQRISARYEAQDGETLGQWLRSLNFIRNVAAHHSGLWNINVLELSPVPTAWSPALRKERPFFYFCLMQHLMRQICPNSTWSQRLRTLLCDEFPRDVGTAFSLDDFGLVEDWQAWTLWQQPGTRSGFQK